MSERPIQVRLAKISPTVALDALLTLPWSPSYALLAFELLADKNFTPLDSQLKFIQKQTKMPKIATPPPSIVLEKNSEYTKNSSAKKEIYELLDCRKQNIYVCIKDSAQFERFLRLNLSTGHNLLNAMREQEYAIYFPNNKRNQIDDFINAGLRLISPKHNGSLLYDILYHEYTLTGGILKVYSENDISAEIIMRASKNDYKKNHVSVISHGTKVAIEAENWLSEIGKNHQLKTYFVT